MGSAGQGKGGPGRRWGTGKVVSDPGRESNTKIGSGVHVRERGSGRGESVRGGGSNLYTEGWGGVIRVRGGRALISGGVRQVRGGVKARIGFKGPSPR